VIIDDNSSLISVIMKISMALILSLLLVKETHAQENRGAVLSVVDKQIIYSNIIEVDSTSKEELYKRARKWVAYTCDVITLEDSNEIVAHGVLFLNQFVLSDILYTIKVKVKDNRYRYEFIHLRVRSRSQGSGVVEYPLESYSIIGKKKFDREVGEELNLKLIPLLEKAMKNPVDDNW
jgi:hypothetical protein